ncbi:MAG: transposase [Chloroflexia bacterium]
MVQPFLREDQFARVYGLLRSEPKIHTKVPERERRFLEGVCWVNRSGARWRFLPGEYGAWNSVYKRCALGRPRRVGAAVHRRGG